MVFLKKFLFSLSLIDLIKAVLNQVDIDSVKNSLILNSKLPSQGGMAFGTISIFGPSVVSLLTTTQNNTIGAALIYNNNQGRVCMFAHNGLHSSENNIDILSNCAKWITSFNKKTVFISHSSKASVYIGMGYKQSPISNAFDINNDLSNIGFIVLDFNSLPSTGTIKISDPITTKLRSFLNSGGGIIFGITAWAMGIPLEKIPPNVLFFDQGIIFTKDYSYGNLQFNSLSKYNSNMYYSVSYFQQIVNNGTLQNNLNNFFVNSVQFCSLSSNINVISGGINHNYNYTSVSVNDVSISGSILNLYNAACSSVNNTFPITGQLSFSCVYLVMANNYVNALPRQNNPQILSGQIFPGLDRFNNTWQIIGTQSYRMTINASRNRWASTGLYALPGAKIYVSIEGPLPLNSLFIRVGPHTDDITKHPMWARYPVISIQYQFNLNTLEFYSYNGGLIYFEIDIVPVSFNFTMTGEIVQSPYYNINQTSINDWIQYIRNYPGPWAEIEGNGYVITVQSTPSLRNLSDPYSLAIYWGTTVINKYYEMTNTNIRSYKERFVLDIDIGGGYMHSGYPIMAFLDQDITMLQISNPANQENCNLYDKWGQYHETGHNFQEDWWTFSEVGEVTNNWFSLYLEENYPAGTCSSMFGNYDWSPDQDSYKNMMEYLKNPNFKNWDAWIALSQFWLIRMNFGGKLIETL